MWMYSSGAEARMKANPNLYQSLLDKEHNPKLVEDIEKGILRFHDSYCLHFVWNKNKQQCVG